MKEITEIKDIPQELINRLTLCPFCDSEKEAVTPLSPYTLRVYCTTCGSVGGIDTDNTGSLYMYWRKREQQEIIDAEQQP